jgi:hypothetical protein
MITNRGRTKQSYMLFLPLIIISICCDRWLLIYFSGYQHKNVLGCIFHSAYIMQGFIGNLIALWPCDLYCKDYYDCLKEINSRKFYNSKDLSGMHFKWIVWISRALKGLAW